MLKIETSTLFNVDLLRITIVRLATYTRQNRRCPTFTSNLLQVSEKCVLSTFTRIAMKQLYHSSFLTLSE